MQVALGQVAQEAVEAARLDRLELRLHEVDVGVQGDLRAIVEADAVGRVDAAQIEMVLHALAERLVRLCENLRHQEEGGADIEAVPIAHDLVAATAGTARSSR